MYNTLGDWDVNWGGGGGGGVGFNPPKKAHSQWGMQRWVGYYQSSVYDEIGWNNNCWAIPSLSEMLFSTRRIWGNLLARSQWHCLLAQIHAGAVYMTNICIITILNVSYYMHHNLIFEARSFLMLSTSFFSCSCLILSISSTVISWSFSSLVSALCLPDPELSLLLLAICLGLGTFLA